MNEELWKLLQKAKKDAALRQIGRASCRERVWTWV